MHGQVQGVFFRACARDEAHRHGVAGWVANRADGAVEAWLEGDPAGVAAVEAWMAGGGPPDARVDRVEVTEPAPAGHRTFEIRG